MPLRALSYAMPDVMPAPPLVDMPFAAIDALRYDDGHDVYYFALPC